VRDRVTLELRAEPGYGVDEDLYEKKLSIGQIESERRL
jgi:hypothetical protein